MRQDRYTITPRAIHRHAAQLCQRHLRFRDHGPKCTALNLLTVLFYAAARLISRAAACASLRDAPSDSALYAALMATLPDIAALQRRLNRALQGDLPRALRRRRQPLAIDLVLIPYHGEPAADADEVYRGRAKSGTSHFHAYATAYVIRKGRRFTVALAYVRRGDDLAEVVKGLLRQAAKAGVRPRYLLLDRGFYAVGVIRYLQAARCPFLMPVPAKGRKADHPKGPSGTRVFHLWKRSGWSRHTLRDEAGREATLRICVRSRN
jgi:putative transposase